MTNRFRESMSFTHPLPVRKHSADATDIATATAAGDVNSDDEDSSSADGSDGTVPRVARGMPLLSSDADSAPCVKRTKKRGTGSNSRMKRRDSPWNIRAQVGGTAQCEW
ncbi:hypothetical protein E4U19_000470 [Claviceps sp. Clav32 group G5]|nr:hypothetical protein E4U19_000470 [Claviceps sp. Clav32 group G5]